MDDLARTRSIARGIPKEKVQKKLFGAIPTCSFDKVLSHNGPRKVRSNNMVGLGLRHASSTWPRLTILSYNFILCVHSMKI